MRLRRTQADRLEREVLKMVRRLNKLDGPIQARLTSYNLTFSRQHGTPLWPVERPDDIILDLSIRLPSEGFKHA